ncbi:MAG: PAS domain-containing protein, partial [Acetobacteraceae bacterium]|nr:PAS domain-containing protein [Acetobacteraceae bacterium]
MHAAGPPVPSLITAGTERLLPPAMRVLPCAIAVLRASDGIILAATPVWVGHFGGPAGRAEPMPDDPFDAIGTGFACSLADLFPGAAAALEQAGGARRPLALRSLQVAGAAPGSAAWDLDIVPHPDAADALLVTARASAACIPKGAPDAGRAAPQSASAADVARPHDPIAASADGPSFLRGVLDALPAHVAVLDDAGMIVAVNAAWERFAHANAAAGGVSLGADYLGVCRAAVLAGDRGADVALHGLEEVIAGRRAVFEMDYACPALHGDQWYLMHAERLPAGTPGVVVAHMDITGLKHAERAAAAVAERLARAQRIGRVGGFEIDLRDGVAAGVNRRSAEYMGLHGSAVRETMERHADWVRRLHPDDRERAERHFLAAIADDERDTDYAQEYRTVTPAGEVRWIAARAEIERDPTTGRPLRMLGAHVDVTELKQAEARARHNADLLAAVMEGTPDVVWAKDPEGRITLANDAALALLGGGDPAKVIGFGARALIPDPDQAARVMANDARIMASGRAEQVEEGFGDRVFQTIKAPLRDAAGRIAGLVGVSRDVTEERRAKAALAESTQRLQLALATGGLGIVEWDLVAGTMRLDAGAEGLTRGLLPAGRPLRADGPERAAWLARIQPE